MTVIVSGGDENKVRIWNLKGIIAPSLLENTATTSHDTVGEENLDSQQLSNPRPQEEQATQRTNDNDKGKKVAGKEDAGAVTPLKRRPSESSSLRDFLDAIAPADDTSDPLSGDFFNTDLRNAPRVEIELHQKKSVSKLSNLFTRKKKDGKHKTRTRPDRQPPVQGTPTASPVDPQSDITSQEFNAMGKGKQKQHFPTDDAVHVSTSPPIASENYAKPRWIMLRHDGSTSRAPIRAKTTDVAYGHMDNRVATAPSQPRKRWKGVLKKKQLQSGSSTVNATGAPQQQDRRPSSPSSSSDSHIGHNDDVEASFCRVVVNLLCFCNRTQLSFEPNPATHSTTPPSNNVATIAPSSIRSPIPLSVPASPQPSDLLSPVVALITSCIPSSSNAVVTSPLPPALENIFPTSMQSPPQAVDPTLLDVLCPEEIAMVLESRRRKCKSAVLSADPAFDQSSVSCGFSAPSPAPYQYSVTLNAPLWPSPSSRHFNAPSSTSSVGLHSSPSLSTSTMPISSVLSQQVPTHEQAFDVTRFINGIAEPAHAQPMLGPPTNTEDDDQILGDCFIHMYKFDFGNR
ncbi:hypothetical protein BU15DRAFT_76728 [Melanogaster broomeanus]|nr:hypothetical protein BU15DRAFT_76728 [Melanogaster broomeanus]